MVVAAVGSISAANWRNHNPMAEAEITIGRQGAGRVKAVTGRLASRCLFTPETLPAKSPFPPPLTSRRLVNPCSQLWLLGRQAVTWKFDAVRVFYGSRITL
jgi:hypothetical protein